MDNKMNEACLNALEAAKRHARRKYPKRTCGFIINNRYQAVKNAALNNTEFEFPVGLLENVGIEDIQMIVVSKTHEPYWPNKTEMEFQEKYNRPLALIFLNKISISEPLIWGAETPIPDILGRKFVHGVTDCWSLIRDCYRLGKDKLAKQQIYEWPYSPIQLPIIPRDDGWWNENNDYYIDNYHRLGFERIPRSEAKPGDCFLMQFMSDKYTHAGVLVDNGDIIHHLPARLSRREKAGVWARNSDFWVRYRGNR